MLTIKFLSHAVGKRSIQAPALILHGKAMDYVDLATPSGYSAKITLVKKHPGAEVRAYWKSGCLPEEKAFLEELLSYLNRVAKQPARNPSVDILACLESQGWSATGEPRMVGSIVRCS